MSNTMQEFIAAVREMRTAQQHYFKSSKKDRAALIHSIMAAKKVDTMLAQFTEASKIQQAHNPSNNQL